MTHIVYRLSDGMAHIDLLHYMNGLAPDRFPPLQGRHFVDGYWWVAQDLGTNECIGFAGLVPFVPCPGVGYLKRAYVHPPFRGKGIQRAFLAQREACARDHGYHLLVTECCDNPPSERNLLAAGFESFIPEQAWGEPGSTYYRKGI